MAIDKHRSSTKSSTDFSTYGLKRPRWCPLCIYQNRCANSSKWTDNLYARLRNPVTCDSMELIAGYRTRCKDLRYMPVRMLRIYLKMLHKGFKDISKIL
ncbi:hypothetical protein GQ472_01830 [archaeon]|nr:hypothetical protein [archaeon]